MECRAVMEPLVTERDEHDNDDKCDSADQYPRNPWNRYWFSDCFHRASFPGAWDGDFSIRSLCQCPPRCLRRLESTLRERCLSTLVQSRGSEDG